MLWITGKPEVERIPLPFSDGEDFVVKIGPVWCQDEQVCPDRDGFFILPVARAVLKGNFSPCKCIVQVDERRILPPRRVVGDKLRARTIPGANGSETPLIFAMHWTLEKDIVRVVWTIVASNPGIEPRMIELIVFPHERIALVHQLNHLIRNVPNDVSDVGISDESERKLVVRRLVEILFFRVIVLHQGICSFCRNEVLDNHNLAFWVRCMSEGDEKNQKPLHEHLLDFEMLE